jgi:hypothetical protein
MGIVFQNFLSTGITGISIEKSLFFARKHGNSMTGQLELDLQRTQSNIDACHFIGYKEFKKKETID